MKQSFVLTALFFLLLTGCKKQDPVNELPLEDIKGKILYTSGSNLAEMDIQSGLSNVIAEKLWMASPAWSPDGSLLLWNDKGSLLGGTFIKITDKQGNIVMEFDNEDVHEPCWSADGITVTLFNTEKEFFTRVNIHTLAEDTMQLNDFEDLLWFPGNPDWSPDGKTLVFSAMEPNHPVNTIWRIDADGSNLTKWMDDCWSPKWSPSGKQLAFANATGINIFSIDNQKSNMVIPGGGTPQWSSDGKMIMYSLLKEPGIGAQGFEIRVRNLETGLERLVLEHAELFDWNDVE